MRHAVKDPSTRRLSYKQIIMHEEKLRKDAEKQKKRERKKAEREQKIAEREREKAEKAAIRLQKKMARDEKKKAKSASRPPVLAARQTVRKVKSRDDAGLRVTRDRIAPNRVRDRESVRLDDAREGGDGAVVDLAEDRDGGLSVDRDDPPMERYSCSIRNSCALDSGVQHATGLDHKHSIGGSTSGTASSAAHSPPSSPPPASVLLLSRAVGSSCGVRCASGAGWPAAML